MILGVSRRDGASLYRSIIKLECLDFFDGQCQSIGPRADPVVLPMLNDFTDNIANAPGAVVQYVQVSADLEVRFHFLCFVLLYPTEITDSS
jgi:hypothetical protein